MIQLILAVTELPAPILTAWEQFDAAHREALTQRLALVIAKAVATPAITEEVTDDE
jgi:hypothetical protein